MFTFFLYLLFFLVFLFLVLGVSVLRIFRSFFPSNRRREAPSGSSRSATSSSRTYIEEDESAPRKTKVFSDNEGEYVDYEEIH